LIDEIRRVIELMMPVEAGKLVQWYNHRARMMPVEAGKLIQQ